MRDDVDEKNAYCSWNILCGSTSSVSCTILHRAQKPGDSSKNGSSANCRLVRKPLAIGMRPNDMNVVTSWRQIRHWLIRRRRVAAESRLDQTLRHADGVVRPHDIGHLGIELDVLAVDLADDFDAAVGAALGQSAGHRDRLAHRHAWLQHEL